MLKDPNGSQLPSLLKRGQLHFSLWWVAVSLLMLLALNFLLIPKSSVTMVDFSSFKKLIVDDSIKRVEMTPSAYYGFTLESRRCGFDPR